jgi:signal transduction histidine kinase
VQTTKSPKLKSLKLRAGSLRSFAKATFSLSIIISAIAVAFSSAVVARDDVTETWLTVNFLPLFAVVYSVLGKKIHEKHSDHVVGWLFAFIGVNAAFSALLNSYVLFNPNFLAGFDKLLYYSKVLGDMIWVPLFVLPITLVILYFPSGSLISPNWRIAVWASLLGMIFTMLSAFHSEPNLIWESSESIGVGAQDRILERLMIVSAALVISGVLGGLASIVVKFRRSKGVERMQIKWLVYGGLVTLMSWGIQSAIGSLLLKYPNLIYANDLMSQFSAFIIPLACSIAIIRHRLWDIDIVVNRTLVYGGLSALIIAAYVLIVGGLGLLFQTKNNVFSGLVAAGVIAVLIQPLRVRMQQSVNKMLFGERDDPAKVLTRLAHQSEKAVNSSAALADLARSIAKLLKIPYVEIRIRRDRVQKARLATWGKPASQVKYIAIRFQGERIGDLVVAVRGPKDKFTEGEEDLLATIAASTATTIRAIQLSDELKNSRQRIISAREEERRRIRRDLHDGLGPQLASQVLGLEAVAQLMEKDPEKAQSLLDSLKTQSKDAILDVRRLVYDLRPPALDDLGLAGALRQSASRYESGQLRFTIDIPEKLPELPAAVETAVFRIAQEAMTNVVRHSGASQGQVRLLREDDYLTVEIQDNGKGLAAKHKAGVGLQAMKERSAELNGDFAFQAVPTGGTLVRAKLPMGSLNE